MGEAHAIVFVIVTLSGQSMCAWVVGMARFEFIKPGMRATGTLCDRFVPVELDHQSQGGAFFDVLVVQRDSQERIPL